ncbi:hypothetical protein [Levilactobacillus spicheri]|uniref:Uncharacterized protein n=1 Tax=Levilactobacillus spicheri TaxID=216463 RepID=A0A0F3RXN7_9LACO|nr:hypothetical protein [Levilactobacillus spicheri]KJW12881.1 hypothetical protein VC81_06435 [Levilactobacillus spicheri]KJW13572.1 hypothetical protein VC81_03680 [Levilactobacillus spicheri]
MAIFRKGYARNVEFNASKRIKTIALEGTQVYRNKVPVGTVLWSEAKAFNSVDFSDIPSNPNLVLDQSVKLGFSLKDVKNGIEFDYSKWLFWWNGGGENSPYWKSGKIGEYLPTPSIVSWNMKLNPQNLARINRDVLLSGNEVKLFSLEFIYGNSSTPNDAGYVSVKMLGEKEIMFVSHTKSSSSPLENSTAFNLQQNVYDGWIVIDSIKAY